MVAQRETVMKILVVMNASDVRLGGGIIQVIINLKEGLRHNKSFKFDYAINIQKNSKIDGLLEDDESKFFVLPNKKKGVVEYMKALHDICIKGKYDAIHVHGSSSTMALELFIAYICGIKKRIAHSHNSQCSHPKLNGFLNHFLRMLSTDNVACSRIAGEWLFGVDNFTILHNAFEINKFAYCAELRKEQRDLEKLSDDTIVLGMIGNLNEQKNPFFALELMDTLVKHNKCILIYIGDGPLREKLEQKSNEMGLDNKVIFSGVCNNVFEKIQMIDIFLFPSLYEGLGISILEAQISGCCCVASTNVPKETKYSDDTSYIELSEKEKWIETIKVYSKLCNDKKLRKQRSDETIKRISNDYSLDKEVVRLEKIYQR